MIINSCPFSVNLRLLCVASCKWIGLWHLVSPPIAGLYYSSSKGAVSTVHWSLEQSQPCCAFKGKKRWLLDRVTDIPRSELTTTGHLSLNSCRSTITALICFALGRGFKIWATLTRCSRKWKMGQRFLVFWRETPPPPYWLTRGPHHLFAPSLP